MHASNSGAGGYDTGAAPVLLNNPGGWSNVSRFAAIALDRLASLERRVEVGGAVALCRVLEKVERRCLDDAMLALRRRSSLDTFMHARGQAEDMLHRLHSLVHSFDVEVDHLVENIVQSTLQDDDHDAAMASTRTS